MDSLLDYVQQNKEYIVDSLFCFFASYGMYTILNDFVNDFINNFVNNFVNNFENKFENGCSITMDTFKDKTHLIKLWKIIKKNGNYNCAYIKVDGQFSGCINNYIS